MVWTIEVKKKGDSAVVALPDAWLEGNGVKFGDAVAVRELPNGALIIEPPAQPREKQAQ